MRAASEPRRSREISTATASPTWLSGISGARSCSCGNEQDACFGQGQRPADIPDWGNGPGRLPPDMRTPEMDAPSLADESPLPGMGMVVFQNPRAVWPAAGQEFRPGDKPEA